MSILEFAAAIAILTTCVGVVAWVVRLGARQDAHEDLCNERYRQIEETQSQLEKVSDERHRENLIRLERMDAKLDRLLSRAVMRRTGD